MNFSKMISALIVLPLLLVLLAAMIGDPHSTVDAMDNRSIASNTNKPFHGKVDKIKSEAITLYNTLIALLPAEERESIQKCLKKLVETDRKKLDNIDHGIVAMTRVLKVIDKNRYIMYS